MTYSEPILEASKRLNISPEAVQTYLDAGRGERAAGVERSLHTTIKPVGSKIGEQTLAEMVFSLKQLEFGLDKHNSLPSECRSCPYLKLCWGECPRTRILKTREGEGNLSYLCRGWKKFFAHTLPKIPRRVASSNALHPTTSLLRRNNTQ